jgi:excisionase family DNA binding protein
MFRNEEFINGGFIMDELLTQKEIAKVFRITPQTLHRWRKIGKIPFVQIGRKILFKVSDVRGIVEQNFHG